MVMVMVMVNLSDFESCAGKHVVAVPKQAALHRRECLRSGDSAFAQVGKSIQQGGDEHVAGDAANRVEVQVQQGGVLDPKCATMQRSPAPFVLSEDAPARKSHAWEARMERRTLFKGVVASGLAASTAHAANNASVGPVPPLPRLTDPGELRGEMLYRRLGTTGEMVSAIGFGGSHFAKPAVAEADSLRLCHAALDRGMNFMDNSWDYNKGESEIRMGRALAQGGYRRRAFLMTKVDGRTKQAATQQLEESLQRLQTDHIDLWQFHEVLRFDDPDRIFAPGGALEAAMDAKKAGKIRYIGFTGHKDPRIHLYMLDVAAKHGFRFDTIMFPTNVMDAHFRSFARQVMPRAVHDRMGILTMKPFGGADGVILKSGTVAPMDCLHYALNLPATVVITGIDDDCALDQAFAAAKTFRPMDQARVAAILGRTEQAAASGDYELFKTSAHFDETAKNADWLGGESPEVQKLAPKNAG